MQNTKNSLKFASRNLTLASCRSWETEKLEHQEIPAYIHTKFRA